MKQKISLVILIFCCLLFVSIVNAQSRPISVSCPFEGRVMNFKDVTQRYEPFSLKRIDFPIEEFTLTIEQGKTSSCLGNTIISGGWFTPGQPYTSANEQPMVDKAKVLIKGAMIKGKIDSYDHVITDVSLINSITAQDAEVVPTAKDDVPNSAVSTTTALVIILILVGSLIYYFISRQRKA